jgi:hypothetical protein
MGAWGAGLYANDFAVDLKPAAAALARSPLDADAAIAALSADFPAAGEDDDEDHVQFWLILADQFEKAGRFEAKIVARARDFLASGEDDRRMEALGMSARDRRQRASALAKLAARLERQNPSLPRAKARAPGPLLFRPGDIFMFPTSEGAARNPYFPKGGHPASWRQDGWGAAVVLAADYAFGYLPWYGFVATARSVREAPTAQSVFDLEVAYVWKAGLCSRMQAEKLGLQRLGAIEIHPSHTDNVDELRRYGQRFAALGHIIDLTAHTISPVRRTIGSLSAA